MPNPGAISYSEGFTLIADAWDFLGSTGLGVLLSVAIAGIIVSVVMGILFRR